MNKGLGAASSPTLIVEYPRNVSWVCVGCAMCCMDREGRERRIMMLEDEAEAISEFTGLKVDLFSSRMDGLEPYIRVMRKKGGACLFLKDRSCTVYRVRPLTCRFYPFSLNSEGNVAVFKLTDEPCPGLGLGKPLKKAFFDRLLTAASKRLLRYC